MVDKLNHDYMCLVRSTQIGTMRFRLAREMVVLPLLFRCYIGQQLCNHLTLL